jgi:hypothetical protein
VIKIKILSGPYADQERTGEETAQLGIDPQKLLAEMGYQNVRWEVDFSQASPQENLEWGRADLVGRIVRALSHERGVWFHGHEFRGFSDEMMVMLEETISNSGLQVAVERDDEDGLVIGTIDIRPNKPFSN